MDAIADNRTNQGRLDTLEKISLALDVEPGELLERAPSGAGSTHDSA